MALSLCFDFCRDLLPVECFVVRLAGMSPWSFCVTRSLAGPWGGGGCWFFLWGFLGNVEAL